MVLAAEKFNPHHDRLGRFASGGGRTGGEWVHSTSPENAQAILKNGIDVERGQYGAFWTARTSAAYGSAEVRVRIKTDKIVSANDPRLRAVGQGLDSKRIAKARELGYQAIHMPGNNPQNDWLVVLDHKAIEITSAKRWVGGELVDVGKEGKALSKKTTAIWWEDWLLLSEDQKSLTDLPDDEKFWQEIRQQVTKEIQPLFLELMLAGVEFATEAVNLVRKKASGQKYNPYHDRLGKFASGGAGGGGSVSNLSSDQQDSMVTAWLFYDGCQPVQKSSRGILDNKFNPKSMADRKAAFMLENIENGVVQPSVHRGIRVDSKGLAALQPGSAFTLPLSSFSKDPAIAKKFATKELFEKRPGNPVVVTIKNCKGYDISQTTAAKKLGFAPQKEVVMAGKFNIASRTQRGGITYLELAMQ